MTHSLAKLMFGASALAAAMPDGARAAPSPSYAGLPQPILEAIAAEDAKCRVAKGKPVASPDLVKRARLISLNTPPDYVVDFNAYICKGVKRPDKAEVIVFRGGLWLPRPDAPPQAGTQAFATAAYGSVIVHGKELDRLLVGDTSPCGRPRATNILHADIARCGRQLAVERGVGRGPDNKLTTTESFYLLPPAHLWEAGTSAERAGNHVQAERLWLAAADLGDPHAMLELGNLYSLGRPGITPDDAKAFSYYLRAAQVPAPPTPITPPYIAGVAPQRTVVASNTRGVAMSDMMVTRRGPPPPPDNSVEMAMLATALAYEDGVGVAADQAQAAAWFRRWAAANEDPLVRAQRARVLADRRIPQSVDDPYTYLTVELLTRTALELCFDHALGTVRIMPAASQQIARKGFTLTSEKATPNSVAAFQGPSYVLHTKMTTGALLVEAYTGGLCKIRTNGAPIAPVEEAFRSLLEKPATAFTAETYSYPLADVALKWRWRRPGLDLNAFLHIDRKAEMVGLQFVPVHEEADPD